MTDDVVPGLERIQVRFDCSSHRLSTEYNPDCSGYFFSSLLSVAKPRIKGHIIYSSALLYLRFVPNVSSHGSTTINHIFPFSFLTVPAHSARQQHLHWLTLGISDMLSGVG